MFKNNYEKINYYSEIIFVVLLLIEGFLQTSCYTFGHKIISFVLWPMVFVGIIPLLFNVYNYKGYLKDKKNILLIIFCFSFFVSTLLMYKYGIYNNIRTQIFLIFQLFVLYLYNKNFDIKKYENLLKICLIIFLIGTITLSSISIIHLITGYSKINLQNDAPDIVYGFTWGRLFGAYWDPNIASVLCCVSLPIIADFYKKAKNILFKILFVLFGIIQFLYIVFSDSRTGIICLTICISSYFLLKFIKYILINNIKIFKLCLIKYILVFIIIVGISFSAPIIVKKTYNLCVVKLNEIKAETKKNDTNYCSLDDTVKPIDEGTIKRGYDLKDISNRRFDIWKSGIDIWKKNILFGVSRANISSYAKEKMPDTYIVNNSQMTFKSMHNLYIDIIVSQGLFGFIPFIAFAILSVINIFRNLRNIYLKSEYVSMLLVIIFVVSTATLVMTEIIYVDSPNSTIFWLSLGFLNYLTLTNTSNKNVVNKGL